MTFIAGKPLRLWLIVAGSVFIVIPMAVIAVGRYYLSDAAYIQRARHDSFWDYAWDRAAVCDDGIAVLRKDGRIRAVNITQRENSLICVRLLQTGNGTKSTSESDGYVRFLLVRIAANGRSILALSRDTLYDLRWRGRVANRHAIAIPPQHASAEDVVGAASPNYLWVGCLNKEEIWKIPLRSVPSPKPHVIHLPSGLLDVRWSSNLSSLLALCKRHIVVLSDSSLIPFATVHLSQDAFSFNVQHGEIVVVGARVRVMVLAPNGSSYHMVKSFNVSTDTGKVFVNDDNSLCCASGDFTIRVTRTSNGMVIWKQLLWITLPDRWSASCNVKMVYWYDYNDEEDIFGRIGCFLYIEHVPDQRQRKRSLRIRIPFAARTFISSPSCLRLFIAHMDCTVTVVDEKHCRIEAVLTPS